MGVLKYLLPLLLVSCTAEREAEYTCDCLRGEMYRKEVLVDYETVSDEYYFSTNNFLNFTEDFNQPSPNVFDFNVSGTVDGADYLSMIGGYGQEKVDTLLCDIDVLFPNSHAWNAVYPNSYACFIHITPFDEVSMTYSACPLKSYYIEVVYLDSVVKMSYR